MGYFQVRYDSRVINYNCRGFIRLATEDFGLESFVTPLYRASTHLALSLKNLPTSVANLIKPLQS